MATLRHGCAGEKDETGPAHRFLPRTPKQSIEKPNTVSSCQQLNLSGTVRLTALQRSQRAKSKLQRQYFAAHDPLAHMDAHVDHAYLRSAVRALDCDLVALLESIVRVY